MKRIRKNIGTDRKILTVTRLSNGDINIDYDPRFPPHVFFDTNVVIGLNAEAIDALNRLKSEQGFIYRYSMLNFVELASHMGDEPDSNTPDPFKKYQSAFKKIASLCDPRPLPSAETVFMKAVGLYHFLSPKWIANESEIAGTLKSFVQANDLAELKRAGFSPEHYKKLRELDGEWFLDFVAKAKEIGGLPDGSDDWANWLGHFYSFLVFRASSKRKTLSSLGRGEQKRVIKFFEGPGGMMVLNHFKHLLVKTIRDQRHEDSNDFYDMLQLLLLRDSNLLFVTDDRPFHQYYAGAEHHRVIPWKMFKKSALSL
ncbi:MAG: hypothetical protein KF751_07440 [Nitrospira sp.]|nr:hypothetical protein [Nitrospira sp.]